MERKHSLEEFVQMTAMVQVTHKDFDAMYQRFGIDEPTWYAIAAHWMARIGADPTLAEKFQQMMFAELERLQAAPPAP
jgi:hypothetical protein